MHEFIAIKIVSYFPSFEANLCLRNNQDSHRSKRVTAMGDLIIWKLSLLYKLSRVVHEWCKENNLLSSSVSKTCVKSQSVGKDKSVSRCSRKNCNG